MENKPEVVVLFEDEAALTLEPLSLTRPVWELRTGIRTLAQKNLAHFPQAKVHYHARQYLNLPAKNEIQAVLKSAEALWINGALLPGQNCRAIADLPPHHALTQGSRVLAFRGLPPRDWLSGTQLPEFGLQKREAPTEVGKLASYLWELVLANSAETEREARELRPLGEIQGAIHPSAVLMNAKDICVAPACQIDPLAVLDATTGPIVLEEGTHVGAHAVIEGPSFLGANCLVKPLSHIRTCSFGEQVRIGGESFGSIVQGFSNKQHGGFLGHSYLGSWCNLGSGTETSNLKNNYSSVRVQVGKNLVDTGQLYVGLMMGDHSKSAIGTVFNTGSVVGVGCIIFGAGFPPRDIPSFHWGGAEKLTRYPLERTLETARVVMSRRDQVLSERDLGILNWIYKNRTLQQTPSTKP